MTLYYVILFFHIVAMLGLAIASAFQWTMFRNAAAASTSQESARWVNATARLPLLVFPSLILILATGVYMAARTHAFSQGWISASFLAILLVAVFNIVGGPAIRALHAKVQEGVELDIRRSISQPSVVMAVRVQIALILTVTLLMVTHTNLSYSLELVAGGLILALSWSLLALRFRT